MIIAPSVSSLEVAPADNYYTIKFPKWQRHSNTLFRKDGDQTHVVAKDRVVIHDQDQSHQALNTVDIANVSVKILKNVPCRAAGMTKRPRKTNFRGIISARYSGTYVSIRRSFVTDQFSKMKFFVDTGADISVLSVALKDKRNKSKFTFCAANNTPITTFGQKLLQLNFGLHRNF